MPQEKPFTAMVMSIIAGSSTMATSIISMQRIGATGTHALFAHVDSMLLGLTTGFMVVSFGFAMFLAPTLSRTWGALVLILSVISILFIHTNFIGAVVGSIAGLIALAFKSRYEVRPQPHGV